MTNLCKQCGNNLGNRHNCIRCGSFNKCPNEKYGCSCSHVPKNYQDGVTCP